MSTPQLQPSAKIIAFPTGRRLLAGSVADRARAAEALASLPAANVVFGGGWYHDEAVREAEVKLKS